MAKRFFASEIWEEDWFLDMPGEYRQFWFYIIGKCDHAGVFRVNMGSFRGLVGVSLSSAKAIELINVGKQRLRVVKEGVWFIEDFFVFQYGPKFNINNQVHKSIFKVYEKYGIDINSLRGLTEVDLTPKRPLKDPKHGAKDKDKDKGILEIREEEGGMGEGEGGWNRMPGTESLELTIPELKAGSAMELMHLGGNKATMEQVYQLWGIFKTQNFTGKKHYATPDHVYSHFINWSKTQKINGTITQQAKRNGKSTGAYQILDDLNQQLGQG